MSEKMIVLVADLDDGVHGEINVLDGPEQAARLVETLLESGFEQERIRVFEAQELLMQVHHRPVVSLLNGGDKRASEEVAPDDDKAPETSAETEDATEPVNARSRALRYEEVAAGAEPFVRNGVRFSSQFRPA